MASKLKAIVFSLVYLAIIQGAFSKSLFNDVSSEDMDTELEELKANLEELRKMNDRLEEIQSEIHPVQAVNQVPVVDPPAQDSAKLTVDDDNLDWWSEESEELKEPIKQDVIQPKLDLFQSQERIFDSLETADPFSPLSPAKAASSLDTFSFSDAKLKRGGGDLVITSQTLTGIKTPADLPFLAQRAPEGNSDYRDLLKRASLSKQKDMAPFAPMTDLKTYRVANDQTEYEANKMAKAIIQDLGARLIKNEPFLIEAFVFPEKLTEVEKEQLQSVLDELDMYM